ncbi:MAG: hypothetical protein F4Z29_06685 [Gemmatimonadetes bacterium]|nr:hypothetical protein [Gemmatimonadota bacterium]
MTEEERAEQERQKGWVKARLECDYKPVFSDLVETVKHDVKVFNEAANASIEAHYDKDDFRIYVSPIQKGRDNDYVEIKLVGKCIKVKQNDKHFVVTFEWIESELRCRLMINKKEYTFPQISQKALGPLLFKDYPPAVES